MTAGLASKGSEKALKQLIQQHVPRQTAGLDAQKSGSGSGSGAIIPLTEPNSSTNQAQSPKPAPEGPPNPLPDASKPAADVLSNAIQKLFERNRKLRPLK